MLMDHEMKHQEPNWLKENLNKNIIAQHEFYNKNRKDEKNTNDLYHGITNNRYLLNSMCRG
jgi:hypothetical protein